MGKNVFSRREQVSSEECIFFGARLQGAVIFCACSCAFHSFFERPATFSSLCVIVLKRSDREICTDVLILFQRQGPRVPRLLFAKSIAVFFVHVDLARQCFQMRSSISKRIFYHSRPLHL